MTTINLKEFLLVHDRRADQSHRGGGAGGKAYLHPLHGGARAGADRQSRKKGCSIPRPTSTGRAARRQTREAYYWHTNTVVRMLERREIEVQEHQAEDLEQRDTGLDALTPYALRELEKGHLHRGPGQVQRETAAGHPYCHLIGFIPLPELEKEETA